MNDKLLHALVGALIVAMLWPLAGVFGIIVCVSAAVGKEVYDRSRPLQHTADTMDAVATIAGGYVAMSWLSGLEALQPLVTLWLVRFA